MPTNVRRPWEDAYTVAFSIVILLVLMLVGYIVFPEMPATAPDEADDAGPQQGVHDEVSTQVDRIVGGLGKQDRAP